jgi:hypothetical protein
VLTEDATSQVGQQGALNASVTVFPNPVIGQTTLEIENAEAGTYQVDLMTVQGQRLKSQSLQITNGGAVTLPIDLSVQANGLYLLRVSNETSATVRRLVKQ